jgi:hypothetical protein
MKNSDRRNRFEQQFTQNSRLTFTLPLNGKILQGKVILSGSVNITGGTTNGVVKGEGGPINLVRRVTVYANPAPGSRYTGGKIVDCSARSLLRYAIFQREKFIGELAGSTLGGGAIGNNTIYLSIPIYWADPSFKRQVETALNADPDAYQSITVQVDTGLPTDCFTGTDRVWDTSGLKCQWADDRENFAGDTYLLYQEDHVYLIPSAQERAQDKALPQDGAFTSWLIMAESTAASTLVDTILQRVTLSADALDYDKFANDIRQQMYDDDWVDSSQVVTGLYFIDFTDGLISGAVPAASLDAKFKVANPGGANLDDLLIYTRRLFAPTGMKSARGAAAARNS